MRDLVQIGVKLERGLWTEIKIKALQKGVTAASLVEIALRDYIQGPEPKRARIEPKPASRAPELSGAEQVIMENKNMLNKEMAALLNEQGFTTATGNAWNVNTVSKVRSRLRKKKTAVQ